MPATDAASEKLYAALQKAGIDVLYDDTDERPGRNRHAST